MRPGSEISGQFHQNALVTLASDDGLIDADFVDPASYDRHRLLGCLRVHIGNGCGRHLKRQARAVDPNVHQKSRPPAHHFWH